MPESQLEDLGFPSHQERQEHPWGTYLRRQGRVPRSNPRSRLAAGRFGRSGFHRPAQNRSQEAAPRSLSHTSSIVVAVSKSRAPAAATSPRKLAHRFTRRYSPDPDDQRTRPQKDRDRLLYSGSLRRLAGVTQVASANEVDMLHNRLTHTLKVAQVGRRVAELLLVKHPRLRGQISPDVVEAAALAHDLGHPPFGHIAEEQLDECLRKVGAGDGYEGNAQSFRIVTKLAYSKSKFVGLNLTRATLAATIKYPWFREADGRHNPKFGAYQSEREDFEFARERLHSSSEKTIEAQIMDLADDITYSIHDIEDFYQVGMIPLDRLVKDPSERAVFFENTKRRWAKRPEVNHFADYEDAFNHIFDWMPLRGPYTGTAAQRRALKPFVSKMILRLCHADQSQRGGRSR